jgi:flagellin
VPNSIQTNVDSIIAQNNLQVNDQAQSNAIQQLTSGYRINSSSDDAAGLAVANQFRSDIAELNQGVQNANDGISALQIVDGGLSNISQMLDRLKTLATESASDTFSGDRGTINQEYQTLLGEVDRQADNIGLGSGAVGSRYATNIAVYIGGSDGVQSNALVNVDLSGAKVDSAGLGILSTNVLGGAGINLAGGAVTATNLNAAPILAGAGDSQVLTVRTAGNETGYTVTLTGGATGLTASQVVDSVNQQLYGSGVSAAIGTDGTLQFYGGNTAFSVSAAAATGGTGVTSGATTQDVTNNNLYTVSATPGGAAAAGDNAVFNVNGNAVTVNFNAGDNVAQQAADINNTLSAYGIQAVVNSAGTGYTLQGTSAFTVTQTAAQGTEIGNATSANPAAPAGTSNIANSNAAIAALTAAVTNLGLVQGKVGTGEDQLQYAVDLANSQISSFSAAESRIRDADVAAEAANLTQAQVLQQSSIAALAQANQEPQALLSLIKNA